MEDAELETPARAPSKARFALSTVDNPGSESAWKWEWTPSLSSGEQRALVYHQLQSYLIVKFDFSVESPIQSVLNTITSSQAANRLIASPAHLRDFLGNIFSRKALMLVSDTLDYTKDSFLGHSYTLRGTLGAFGTSLLNDLNDEGWYQVTYKNVRRSSSGASASGGSGAGRGGDGSGDGSGHGRGGRGGSGGGSGSGSPGDGRGGAGDGPGRPRGAGRGRDGPGIVPRVPNEFEKVPFAVKVQGFVSPEKPHKDDIAGMDSFKDILWKRCEKFLRHPVMKHFHPGNRYFYDPRAPDEQNSEIFLFHGTRSAWLGSFQARGISPSRNFTEFSTTPSFYVTNSITFAYEHVFHSHPGSSFAVDRALSRNENPPPLNAPLLLGFKLSTHVLRGHVPPNGTHVPFEVSYYENDSKAWEEFCLNNLDGKPESSGREFDIITGPVCLTHEEESSEEEHSLPIRRCRGVRVRGNLIYQSAFISKRAKAYLQSCYEKGIVEDRVFSPDGVFQPR